MVGVVAELGKRHGNVHHDQDVRGIRDGRACDGLATSVRRPGSKPGECLAPHGLDSTCRFRRPAEIFADPRFRTVNARSGLVVEARKSPKEICNLRADSLVAVADS